MNSELAAAYAVMLASGTVCAVLVALMLRDAWRRSRAKPSAPVLTHGGTVTTPVSKPRIRISRDGWIRNDGSGFPFAHHTLVELAFDDGRMLLTPHIETAGYWHDSWWKRETMTQGRKFAFYRIARLAPPMKTAPRIAR